MDSARDGRTRCSSIGEALARLPPSLAGCVIRAYSVIASARAIFSSYTSYKPYTDCRGSVFRVFRPVKTALVRFLSHTAFKPDCSLPTRSPIESRPALEDWVAAVSDRINVVLNSNLWVDRRFRNVIHSDMLERRT